MRHFFSTRIRVVLVAALLIAVVLAVVGSLTDKEIESYIATGEPMDKAGAYGIQGGAALFAEKMQGDYYNVMGLPVCRLFLMLRTLAPELMEDIQ